MFTSNRFFLLQDWVLVMAEIIPPEQKRNYLPFIKEHLGKISQREIAKLLNIGKTTVNRWSSEMGFKYKKNTVNEDFFDSFNEESVYLLGYIYADGNIAWNIKKGYYSLTITASAKDKDYLERIRQLLNSTKPLLYSEKTNSYRLIVNSKKLCLKLMQLGVIPRKSLVVKFPTFIPQKYINHFIRGIIDGDGCVYYCKRKRSSYFSIKIYSGSEIFMIDLVKKIKELFGIEGNVRKANQSTYGVDYSCSRGERLAKFIYSGSNIFLKRKYLKYTENILEENKMGGNNRYFFTSESVTEGHPDKI